MKKKYLGNITTIIKLISMIIAGYVVGIGVSLGLQLPFNEAQITDAISIIIFIIIALLDAKYPNTFLTNALNEPQITVNLDPSKLEEAIQEAESEAAVGVDDDCVVSDEDDQQ